MPPLPPENTTRYFLDYKGPQGQHTMQFRMPSSVPVSDAASTITAFILKLTPIVYNTVQFWQLRRAVQGSRLSFPVEWVQVNGGVAGTLPAHQYPRFLSFVGRSSAGKRVRITLIGLDLNADNDYRVFRTEYPQVGQAVDFLNTSIPAFIAIDGNVATWKNYANTGFNAYFQRKRRRQ